MYPKPEPDSDPKKLVRIGFGSDMLNSLDFGSVRIIPKIQKSIQRNPKNHQQLSLFGLYPKIECPKKPKHLLPL